MTEMICLDKEYSTTRLLTKEKPVIEKKEEDKFESVLFLPEGEERKGEGGLRTKGYFKKSYEDKPLISIITVVYNGKQFLEETIQSVINQSYDNVEYIIIDGGSTDGTLDIIRKYEKEIDYWVSERDRGMYFAINKGFSLATGIIIGLLNSDDMIQVKALNEIQIEFKKNKVDGLYGDIYKIDSKGNKLEKRKSLNVSYLTLLISEHGTFLPHPTLYLSREAIKNKIGLYNTQYLYASDYEYVLRCLKVLNLQKIESIIVYFRYHEDSITASGKLNIEREAILLANNLNKVNKVKRNFIYFFMWIQYKVKSYLYNWR